uniref:Uncharacterized protein n=1 Tax=Romanomermis culicivorax TaxID=13658 RepID=A0A915JGH0_ROMCU
MDVLTVLTRSIHAQRDAVDYDDQHAYPLKPRAQELRKSLNDLIIVTTKKSRKDMENTPSEHRQRAFRNYDQGERGVERDTDLDARPCRGSLGINEHNILRKKEEKFVGVSVRLFPMKFWNR